ncbi:unnamed protein product [Acanthoscelides obtectus]|uniref:Uncharacterized protein n=1 Tax=Acanthoscelides obtectus TaxID=200917 RepID=A0A9P0M877_ACAOB|nr:unnamed protein product [Acanthoscelides obtectus]CAK1666791.1 hypothetical protein AOBTE_LOCUS25495 [Acanthoscelides obtectus]
MKCYIVFFKKNAGEMVKASTQPKTRARPIGFGRRVYKFFKNVGLLGFRVPLDKFATFHSYIHFHKKLSLANDRPPEKNSCGRPWSQCFVIRYANKHAPLVTENMEELIS